MSSITLLFSLIIGAFSIDFGEDFLHLQLANCSPGSLDALNCLLPTPHLDFSLPNVLVNHCNVRVKAQYSCDLRQNTNIG